MSSSGRDSHEPVYATSVTRQNDVQTRDETETAGPSNISGDGADSASVVSESSSESLQSIGRPNKYRGPPSTWRSWTEAERQLATSLDQERAADLAIHLYNSHALKRRLWQSKGACTVQGWRGKERWRQPQIPLGIEAVGDGRDTFCPQKGWTAWPMKPELVPREGGGITRSSSHEVKVNWKHQYRAKTKVPRSSEVLGDCIVGGVLGIAKEKYQERGRDHPQRDSERESYSPSSSGTHTPVPSPSRGKDSLTLDESAAAGGREGRHGAASHRLSVPRSGLVPMADDEKAHELLQPIAHHLLSNFDSLLMGLHHAREAYLSSQDEKVSKDHTRPTKKGKGQPLKNPRAFTTPTSIVTQDRNVLDDSVLASKERKGMTRRTRKYSQARSGSPPDLAGNESDSDYTAEKESGSSSHLSDGVSPAPSPSVKQRRVVGNPTAKAHYRNKKQEQLGLRDWSDILGVASMVGWEPEAISRAAVRCSTLFGEGINFRTLAEEETFLGDGRVLEYRPGMASPLVVRGRTEARFFEHKHTAIRDYPQHIQVQINSVRDERSVGFAHTSSFVSYYTHYCRWMLTACSRTQPKDQWSPAEDSLLRDLKSIWPLTWSEIATHCKLLQIHLN
jgi:hypothetical protein